MGDKGTLWLPEQASTVAGDIDSLFYFVYWVSVVFFIGVVGAMTYFAVRYRRRSPHDRPEPVHESKLLEVAWIVVPTILVLIVFTWGFKSFMTLSVSPPGSYEITVRAQKWSWTFEYPNGVISAGELHVPVGRPVRLNMSSSDVLHSFFIPAFRVKQDIVPDRYSSIWFEATKQDTFQAYCTEYCGTQHSGMLAKVVVHSQDDFNTWLQESGIDPDASPAERGKIIFEQRACNSCHSVDGSRIVGPTMLGLFGSQRQFEDGTSATADENFIRESILDPMAKVAQGYPPAMAPVFGDLTAEDMDNLIAYIKEQQ